MAMENVEVLGMIRPTKEAWFVVMLNGEKSLRVNDDEITWIVNDSASAPTLTETGEGDEVKIVGSREVIRRLLEGTGAAAA